MRVRGCSMLALLAGVLTFGAGSAEAARCGHVTYAYSVDGTAYDAVFAGLDYHGAIQTSGVGCAAARGFVLRYATAALRNATSRNDFRPPRSLAGYRCSRTRDGDDSGRDYCRKGRSHIFFSDSTGQFA